MRDCQRVRFKELCYRRIFYVLFLCVLAASAFINYNNLILANIYYVYNNTYAIAMVSYQVILFLFETVTFVSIYRNLATKHHYEF